MGEYPTQLIIAKVIALFKNDRKPNPTTIVQLVYYLVFNKKKKKILCKRLVKFSEI